MASETVFGFQGGVDIWAGFCLLAICSYVTWTDVSEGLITNLANLALACSGLLFNLLRDSAAVPAIALQAVLAYCAIWLLVKMHERWRGVRGLGAGDVKFIGAATLWLGAANMPWMILLACVSALATVGILRWTGRPIDGRSRIIFGPHLALGLLAIWGWMRIL